MESSSFKSKIVAKMEAESSEPSQSQLHPGIGDGLLILIFFLSLVTFGLINVTLSWVLPRVITLGRSSQWRFRNVAVSFLHASMSAPLCFYCYFSYEGQLSSLHDMVTGGSDAAYIVLTISIGYFLYDGLDYAVQGRTFSSWEITVHHLASTAPTVYIVVYRVSGWIAILSLTVETNSIFLHLRKMLQMAGVPAYSWTYTVVKILNIVTFVVFRGMAQTLLLAGLLTIYDTATPFYVGLASLVTVFMVVATPIFFWRLIKSDFLNSVKKEEGATGDANGDSDTKAPSSPFSELTRKAKLN